MEFDFAYTEKEERFRQEVRDWIEKNIPKQMRIPAASHMGADLTEEQYWFWRQKHKELGAKGWLFPTYPKEYGGGGLSPAQGGILEQEFRRANVRHAFTISAGFGSLLVWGTEEQKGKFLAPILRGEKYASMKFTEPHSGSDNASYESRAIRDGDDWILNGSSVFISGAPFTGPDLFYGPMLTDPDAPRHRNLGFFIIPHPWPGLELRHMNLASDFPGGDGGEQYFVFMDNMRVPSDHLIGGDHEGWQVAMTTGEAEHGGQGQIAPHDGAVESLLTYVKEKRRKEEHPGGDPVLHQTAMDAYLDAHVGGLFGKRTAWLNSSGTEMSWEGPATHYFHMEYYGMRNPPRMRHVMGMYALLNRQEPWAPHEGEQDVYQRRHFLSQHGAGSFNIAKVIVARRIGISRTKERAAVTPATMTKAKPQEITVIT